MSKRQTMQIFRASNAKRRDDPEVVQALMPDGPGMATSQSPLPEAAQKGIARLIEAGIDDGNIIKLLFSVPGFSLTYVWFKPRFPLARHRHNTDCLYYIVSGEVSMGGDHLGAGDGFFVPNGCFYTFSVGEEGVEFIEFRHTSSYDYYFSGGSEAYWDKAVKAVVENRDAWKLATLPRPAA